VTSPVAAAGVHGDTAAASRKVSKTSTFGDDVWVFDTATHSAKRRLDWTRQFASGHSLADPGNEELLLTCKELVYHLLLGWERRKAIKPTSACTYAFALLDSVNWMLEQGIRRFADLDQHEISRLRVALSERQWKYIVGARKWVKLVEPLRFKPVHVHHKLSPLRDLVRARAFIADTPDWNPEHDEAERGGTIRDERAGEHSPIPFELAVTLYAEALQWVLVYGPILLEAKTAANAAYLSARKRVPDTRAIWRSDALRAIHGVGGSIEIDGRTVDLSGIGKRAFNALIRHLETACFLVSSGFTGMRIHELSNLNVECLAVRHVGGRALLCLKSRESKTATGGSTEPAEWVAGFDTADNPVRSAIEMMREVAADERHAAGLSALFVTKAETLTVDGNAMPMSTQAMNRRLNQFLQAVIPGAEWHLTTHQLRKTFARFVARNHKLGLLALRRHFKHVSLAMTEHYGGVDFELLSAIADERHDEMREALHEILGSEYLGGKLGIEITKSNASFRGVAGKEALADWVDAFLKGDSPLMSHPYGMCFVFRETARCGTDADRVGLRTCMGCSNLIVGPRHAPWWEDRIRELDQFEKQMISAGLWSSSRAVALADDRETAQAMLGLIRAGTRDDKYGQS
jgi:integrase